MRKVKKILDINDEVIDYIGGSSVSIDICSISHTPVHIHNSAVELIYCLEGELNIHCNHEILTLDKGHIFTVDAEDVHCLYSKKKNLIIVMHIDLHKLDRSWEFLQNTYLACEDNSCKPYQRGPLQRIKNMVLAAAYLYTKNGQLSISDGKKISNKILDVLVEYFDWFNYINPYPNTNEEIRSRIHAIFAYCSNNLTNKVTIAELAKTVHINENYLSQFIRKSPYHSFRRMMAYMRCFVAQSLLLTTEMSVIEVSNHCGFSDDKYFYKYFKSIWGKTPMEHRQWYREYIKEEDNIAAISNSEAYKILEPYAAEYFAKHILFE